MGRSVEDLERATEAYWQTLEARQAARDERAAQDD